MTRIGINRASSTHDAHWFRCSLSDFVTQFGAEATESLISQLGNGKESVSNFSAQVAKGEAVSGEIRIPTDCVSWQRHGRPSAALMCFIVRMEPR